MNNEETKVLNQSEETVVMNNATDKREETVVENTATATAKKKSVINDKAAYAAGGFAAGLASGVAGSAFAASPDKPVDVAEEVVVAPENTEEVAAEPAVAAEPTTTQTTTAAYTQTAAAPEPVYAAPDPEDVLVATDEGVRIAQVDDSASFAEAFADARAQVGPGGAFEWRGHVYNTYYEEEWNNMSAEARAEYQQKIDYETISGDTTEPTSTVADQHTMASDTEMIDEQSDGDSIKILGVEAVVDAEGNPMTVAAIEVEGEQALLVDVDNDGTMDALIADDNCDGQIDPYQEIYDISDCGIETNDLMQGMAAEQDPNTYMAYNDDMPDYMNDADVSAMA
ncbi:MAG: hypothetical protein E7091_03055 [Bacteroidales bacterium]|nr:hypothetical protein [Bacteroidales bacterium]